MNKKYPPVKVVSIDFKRRAKGREIARKLGEFNALLDSLRELSEALTDELMGIKAFDIAYATFSAWQVFERIEIPQEDILRIEAGNGGSRHA